MTDLVQLAYQREAKRLQVKAASGTRGCVKAREPIQLPFPPSTNRLWRAVNGRNISSARYRQWRGAALAELMIQRPQRICGPYIMTVVATRPDRRRRDLSNTLKALEDLLVAGGIVRDDSDAQSIRLSWSEAAPDKLAGVQVILEAA